MLKLSVMTVALLAVSPGAFAQPAGSGGFPQQIPPSPQAPKAEPDIRLQTPPPAPAAGGEQGAQIRVERLVVTGASAFTQAPLLQAAGFAPGQTMDMAQLTAAAARIAAFYNEHGYFLAQAYLPPEDIQGGVVTIAVIEGRYGEIAVTNHARLSDRVVGQALRGLDRGDPVASGPLQRRLLLLSDVPGVRLRSTLSPGTEVGSSDLLVELSPGPRVSGSLEADNAGNRYTGQARVGGTVDFNNPTGSGDRISLRLLTAGSGLQYARGAYETRLGAAVVGVSYADVRYRLGKEFSPLRARGSVHIASLYGDYPLVRSQAGNLSLLADVTARRFEDRVGATNTAADREAAGVTLGLEGDHRDARGGGGLTTYWIALTRGRIDLRTASARAADRASVRTGGDYSKAAFSIDRLQALGGPLELYGSLRGQAGSKNLDVFEKMELGGAYGVRAYPEGEGYGDRGYVATVEGRWLLARPVLDGRVRLIGFVDAGQVQVAENPYFAGRNRLSRSGAGVGLIWSDPSNLQFKATYAHRLGSERALSGGDSSGRVWVQLVKLF